MMIDESKLLRHLHNEKMRLIGLQDKMLCMSPDLNRGQLIQVENLMRFVQTDVKIKVDPEPIKTFEQEVPHFVAEWIEYQKCDASDFYRVSEEAAKGDSIHFTLFRLFEPTNNEVEIAMRSRVKKWLERERTNYFKLVDAVRHGYIIEEEPLYYIRMTKAVAKAAKPQNPILRYLKTENKDTWYYGGKDSTNNWAQMKFTAEERDYWLDKLKAIGLEAVKVGEEDE